MIPFRVKEKINALRCSWYLGRAIEALSPLTVATRDLRAEVHMMVGHNHLMRALAALHTLEERLKQAALARTWWIHLSTNVT
jgi:hypothetical protein